MQEPPFGWTTYGRVVRVVDGDTVDVEIRRIVRVRLDDVYASEIRTKDLKEKARGFLHKKYLEDKILRKYVKLFIPTKGSIDIKQFLTLDRVVGRIFRRGEDINELMKKMVKEI